MKARDEERLHQRLMDGTADPGMYPNCAEHIGMLDRGDDDERARWQAAYDEWWAEQNKPAISEEGKS